MARCFFLAMMLVLAACSSPGDQRREQQRLLASLPGNDQALAGQAVQNALERNPHGEPVAWANDASGNSGSVTPLATYVTTSGYPCRRYSEALRVDGSAERFTATACRNETGVWVPVEER